MLRPSVWRLDRRWQYCAGSKQSPQRRDDSLHSLNSSWRRRVSFCVPSTPFPVLPGRLRTNRVFQEQCPDCFEHRRPVRENLPGGIDRFPRHCPSSSERIPTIPWRYCFQLRDCRWENTAVVAAVLVLLVDTARLEWPFRPFAVPCCSIPARVSCFVERP